MQDNTIGLAPLHEVISKIHYQRNNSLFTIANALLLTVEGIDEETLTGIKADAYSTEEIKKSDNIKIRKCAHGLEH